MIVLIGGEKGGTGKSTTATNLASRFARAGASVLLVDTDKQGSASDWASIREDAGIEPRVTVVAKFGKIARDLLDLSERYDMLIVDAGGRDSVELRQAMGVADVMFTPIQASQFDVATLDTLNDVYTLIDATRAAPLPLFVFVNRASPNPLVNEYKEAQAVIAEYPNFRLSRVVVRDRKAFRAAASEGRAVDEMPRRDAAACAEMALLFEEVSNVYQTA